MTSENNKYENTVKILTTLQKTKFKHNTANNLVCNIFVTRLYWKNIYGSIDIKINEI